MDWTYSFFIFTVFLLHDTTFAEDLNSRKEYLLNSFIDVEDGTYYKSKLAHAIVDVPEENLQTFGSTDDELLTEEQKQEFQHTFQTSDRGNEPRRRKFRKDTNYLWPNGIIPYVFAIHQFESSNSVKVILKAMEHWGKYTCLKFVELDSQEYYDVINDVTKEGHLEIGTGNRGCASMVGFSGPNIRKMFLREKYCIWFGTIVHELGHVIGFFHEHARSDRDNYVTVLENNIRPRDVMNFNKLTHSTNEAPYDLASDMQYGPKFFSQNGHYTLKAKDPFLQFLMGRRIGLSFYDILEANKAYNCSTKCGGVPVCQNEGFLLKDCTCHCPDGLAGVTCEEISRSESKGNGYIHDLSYGGVLKITSPYPKARALWFIKSPAGTTMRIMFKIDLNRSERTHTCVHWVEIRYNLLGQEGPRFCGRSGEAETLIQTTSNLLMIKYNGEIGDHKTLSGDGFFINIHVVGLVVTRVKCSFSDADVNSCPFSNSGFRRMVIPLSWLQKNNMRMNEKRRSYLYMNSKTTNFKSKATSTSSEINAGTWCFKFDYFMYGNGSQTTLQLRALITKQPFERRYHAPARSGLFHTRNTNMEHDGENTRISGNKHDIRKEKHHLGSKDIKDSQQSNKPSEERSGVIENLSNVLNALKRALNLEVSETKDEESLDLDDDSSSILSEDLAKHDNKHTADESRKEVYQRSQTMNDYIMQGTEIHHVRKTLESSRSSASQQRKMLMWATFELSRHVKHVEISVKSSDVFKFQFYGVVNAYSTITIDEFDISPELCSQPDKTVDIDSRIDSVQAEGDVLFHCTFEVDICGFEHDPSLGSILWVRTQKSNVFGPAYDHTFGKGARGMYLSRDRLSQTRGSKGGIVSQEFDLKTPDGCVKFWFYVWGFSPGTLGLYRRDSERRYLKLWTYSVKWLHNKDWVQAKVPVKTNVPFKLVFFTVVDYWWGAYAVDDISITTGHC